MRTAAASIAAPIIGPAVLTGAPSPTEDVNVVVEGSAAVDGSDVDVVVVVL